MTGPKMEMQNVRKFGKTWELCAGCLLVVVGIGLIDCAEDLPLEFWTMVAMCAGGVLACLMGLLLIWNGRIEKPDLSLELLKMFETLRECLPAYQA
jgi:hypothetical protein